MERPPIGSMVWDSGGLVPGKVLSHGKYMILVEWPDADAWMLPGELRPQSLHQQSLSRAESLDLADSLYRKAKPGIWEWVNWGAIAIWLMSVAIILLIWALNHPRAR